MNGARPHRAPTHLDWNVVVSVKEHGFVNARDLLGEFGIVRASPYHNVFVMKVDSVAEFLERLDRRLADNPDLLAYVARIAPAQVAFDFATPQEFEERAREAVSRWVPELAGKRFHVRMHRRGLKGALLSPVEERLLDEALLEALQKAGAEGALRFDDADAVIDLETVDRRAGLALWTRADVERHPFLKPG